LARVRTGIATALDDLAASIPGDGISVAGILAQLGGRGYGFAIFLLAAPNLTPGPSLPGFSTLFGLPMLALALGMLLGRPHPVLPRFLGDRRIARARLVRMLGLMVPVARQADRLLRPRMPALVRARRLDAAALVALSVLLVLPFPFVSLAAAGAALLIALGLLAEDGGAIALGLVATLASLALYGGFVWLAYAAYMAV
jgi:hypothetical protein